MRLDFYLKNQPVFGFAGLWEEWRDNKTGEILETCTIITTAANDVLSSVHDRKPVILKAEITSNGLTQKRQIKRNCKNYSRFIWRKRTRDFQGNSFTKNF